MQARLLFLSAATLVAGCTGGSKTTSLDRVSAAPPAISATTQLLGSNGELRGTAALIQSADGVRVDVRLDGMVPGTYAVHLHAIGRCDTPDFASAGAHFNPTAQKHGSLNSAGPHLGDLPNIVVAANGGGSLAATVAGLQLVGGATPLLDADGAAVIVHAAADDYRTDPSGNSGARIACGTLRRR